jgi:leucyl aminopeptidase (aminopeptidase T)
MTWPEKEAITPAVVDMLRVNMGLKPQETLLVMADIPRSEDWQAQRRERLQAMLERAILSRLVAEIAAEQFPDCPVHFLPFPCTGGHGTDPDAATAARMREADVIVALTSFSLSHTNAREGATQAGARLASMPGFEAAMFAPGGPMAADYGQIAADCRAFADLLTAAGSVVVRTPHGTDLRFSLGGRPGEIDDGLYGTEPGAWGNLPAGECYAAPVEGSAEGQLVVPARWHPGLAEPMTLRFAQGEVVEVLGGGAVGDEFRALLRPGDADPLYRARRNLAELGIGTNPNARRPDNVLESEKIKGTVHLAIGDNIHMGGRVESDLHQDFVLPEPDLLLDGSQVIVAGEWRI